jgi:hypothetical protein
MKALLRILADQYQVGLLESRADLTSYRHRSRIQDHAVFNFYLRYW